MADISIPKDDYGYNLNFTVHEDDDTAFDLNGYTITMKVWSQDVESDPIVSATCSPDVAASGTCHYTIVDGNFDTEGDYLLELHLTKAGIVSSTKQYTLRVTESP